MFCLEMAPRVVFQPSLLYSCIYSTLHVPLAVISQKSANRSWNPPPCAAQRNATQKKRNLAGRAAFAFSIGAPLGAWSALASMPRSDAATMSWAAAGAAGTYSCALMVLLETALPRAAVWAAGAVRGGAGRARSLTASSVLVELYLAAVAFMPVTALAQASLRRETLRLSRHFSTAGKRFVPAVEYSGLGSALVCDAANYKKLD